jgi:hypothetical protein
MDTDELSVHFWVTILKQHFDNLAEIGVELVKGLALGVRSWKTGDISYEKPGVRATLDYSRKVAQLGSPPFKVTSARLCVPFSHLATHAGVGHSLTYVTASMYCARISSAWSRGSGGS